MTEWKNVKGFEGLYKVSNFGRIKSIERLVICGNGKRLIKERKKRLTKIKIGYTQVSLYKNNIHTLQYVHRIVAETFIPNPKNLPQINHKNSIKNDNRVENLEWVTVKENVNHAINSNRMNHLFGENHYNSKYSNKTIENIKKLKKKGIKSKEISKKYNISISHCNAVCRGVWRINK